MGSRGGTDETPDEAVVRAVGGDLAALEGLLRAHAPSVCAELGVDPRWQRSFDRDDILQVTSMEAILRIGSLRSRSVVGFRTWLARIAENNVRDAVRGLESQKRSPVEGRVTHDAQGRSARTLLAMVGGVQPSASAVLNGQEEVARLHRALEKLPSLYRDIVTRVDLEERPVDAIARELGRSHGAVHMLRHRAHERLRELLGE